MGVIEAVWEGTISWLRSRQAERLLRALIVAVSFLFVLLFLYTALRRMRYPFDLEWVESGILVSVDRLVHHQPLYAQPSFSYVPYLYAPLYFYICAFVAKFTGVSFFTLRLVSTLSALGSMGLLFAFVYRETRDAFCGIAAMGLFASLNAFIGAWFDIGRVDSLFIFFFLLALFCTRFAPPLIAALAWVLAFQTKQSAIAIAIPFLLTYWERQRKSRVGVALASYAVLALGSIWYFDRLNGGWYRFYVFGTTAGLPSVMRLAALYISEVVLAPLAPAILVVAAALIFTAPSMRTRAARFYLAGSVMLFLAFWWVHAHRGVGNTMQALYVWIAVVFGIGLHRLLKLQATAPAASGLATGTGAPAAGAVIVLFAVLAQLGSQLYNPGQFIPTPARRQIREGLEAQLRSIPGDVYVVNHSWDAVVAGKQPHAEGEAVGAVVDAGGPQAAAMIADVRQATMDHELAAIVVDGGYEDYVKWLTPEELKQYPVEVSASGSNTPRFLTSQPTLILLPCSALTDGLAARISPDGVAPPTKACEAGAR